MAAIPFHVQRIDHVKVCVPDRAEAARWYADVFGLAILHGPAWDAAASIPDGPLFLGVDEAPNGVKLVLFEGEPRGTHPPRGITRAAFGVDGPSFLRFLDRLDELTLFTEDGERLTSGHLVDQWIAWSLYFTDPYGNPYELLTYDYEQVKRHMRPEQSS